MPTANDIIDSVWEGLVSAWAWINGNWDAVAFIVLALLAILAAIHVVTSKEIMHSAFYLAFVFVCVAATYYFLNAEFIGAVQVVVYVGAITILYAFSIMPTRRTIKEGDSDE